MQTFKYKLEAQTKIESCCAVCMLVDFSIYQNERQHLRRPKARPENVLYNNFIKHNVYHHYHSMFLHYHSYGKGSFFSWDVKLF